MKKVIRSLFLTFLAILITSCSTLSASALASRSLSKQLYGTNRIYIYDETYTSDDCPSNDSGTAKCDVGTLPGKSLVEKVWNWFIKHKIFEGYSNQAEILSGIIGDMSSETSLIPFGIESNGIFGCMPQYCPDLNEQIIANSLNEEAAIYFTRSIFWTTNGLITPEETSIPLGFPKDGTMFYIADDVSESAIDSAIDTNLTYLMETYGRYGGLTGDDPSLGGYSMKNFIAGIDSATNKTGEAGVQAYAELFALVVSNSPCGSTCPDGGTPQDEGVKAYAATIPGANPNVAQQKLALRIQNAKYIYNTYTSKVQTDCSATTLPGNTVKEKIWNWMVAQNISGISDDPIVMSGILGGLLSEESPTKEWEEVEPDLFHYEGGSTKSISIIHTNACGSDSSCPNGNTLKRLIENAGLDDYWGKENSELPEDVIDTAIDIEMTFLFNEYDKFSEGFIPALDEIDHDYKAIAEAFVALVYVRHTSPLYEVENQSLKDYLNRKGAYTSFSNLYIAPERAQQVYDNFASSYTVNPNTTYNANNTSTSSTAALSDAAAISGNNTNYAGDTVWSEEELAKIERYKSVYQYAVQNADMSGIPWQLLAVIHKREHGLAINNPENGEGIWQLTDYTERGTNSKAFPHTTEDVPTEEFQRQTTIAVDEVIVPKYTKYCSNYNISSDEAIKCILFYYNGIGNTDNPSSACNYIQRGKSLGFSDKEAADLGEGSPYVMNRFDADRDGTKQETMNPVWKGMYENNGICNPNLTDQRFGTFVLYQALAGSSSGCTTSAEAYDGDYPQYIQEGDATPYGVKTVNSSGCGPASMAMLATYQSGQEISIVDVINITQSTDYYNLTGGSGMTALDKKVGEAYSLNVEGYAYSSTSDAKAKMKEYLDDGWSLHMSGAGAYPYCTSSPDCGHYVGVFGWADREAETVMVADSLSSHGGNAIYPLDTIVDYMHLGEFSAIKNPSGVPGKVTTCTSPASTCGSSSSSGSYTVGEGGLDFESAKQFMRNYGANKNGFSQSVIPGFWDICNGGGSNCVTFSHFFLNAFTPHTTTDNGGPTGGYTASSIANSFGYTIDNTPSVYSIFSVGVHTGVILGYYDGEWIVGHANCYSDGIGEGNGGDGINFPGKKKSAIPYGIGAGFVIKNSDIKTATGNIGGTISYVHLNDVDTAKIQQFLNNGEL